MDGKVVGIVLAGGASRRFGSPKAFANLGDKAFYQLSIEALHTFTDSIVIVTNEQLENRFTDKKGIQLITDINKYAGKGPLAGLYSAMWHQQAEWYATVPVDVPFIDSATYMKLLKNREAGKEVIVPVSNGKLQPLIALYHYSLKARIKNLLESDRLAMRDLFQVSEMKYVDFTDEKPFININRLEDYDSYIRDRG